MLTDYTTPRRGRRVGSTLAIADEIRRAAGAR